MHLAPVAAPGASTSLTPTAVTAFLLDVWPRPGIVLGPAEQPGAPLRLRTLDSEALGRQCPPGGSLPGGVLPDGVLPGSWGLSYAEIVDALGAYTPCDTRFTHS